jgi:hypothetical protein
VSPIRLVAYGGKEDRRRAPEMGEPVHELK